MKWDTKMESPVPMITEPSFASLDFEQFGEVTIAPLTMNLAGQLLASGRADMAAVLVEPDPQPTLVITDVAAGKGGAALDIAAGMVVAKLNGKPVTTMEELRKNFNRVTSERGFCGKQPEEEMTHGKKAVPGEEKMDDDKDSLAALIGGLHEKRQHSSTAETDAVEELDTESDDGSNMTANTWVLQTKDGAELVKNYRKTLKLQSMMAAEGIRPMTPAVKAAVHSIGGSEPAAGEDTPEMMDPLISGLLRGIFGAKGAAKAKAKQHHKLHETFELAEPGSPEREIALQALLDAIPAIPIEERKIGRGGQRWLPLDPAF
jgi:hypothetical protein